MGYKWTDVQNIAIELNDTFPDIDPTYINFVELRNKVQAIPGFDDAPERCGEKILEAIQAAWLEERR
jgi:FeS assembly protein IscX